MKSRFGLLMLVFAVIAPLALAGATPGPAMEGGPAVLAESSVVDQALSPVGRKVLAVGGLAIGLFALLAMAQENVRDALLKVTKALPNGAATIYSDGIGEISG